MYTKSINVNDCQRIALLLSIAELNRLPALVIRMKKRIKRDSFLPFRLGNKSGLIAYDELSMPDSQSAATELYKLSV